MKIEKLILTGDKKLEQMSQFSDSGTEIDQLQEVKSQMKLKKIKLGLKNSGE